MLKKTHVIWLCVSVAALFAGTQFAKKKIQIVEKPVEVVKTKEVEVPAVIPEDYKAAKQFYDWFFQANWFEKNEILKGVPSVQVIILLDDEVKGSVTESELKDSIELSLRKNGVPVKDNPAFLLEFSIDGVWNENKTIYSYTTSMSLLEVVPILRLGGFKKASLTIWQNNYVGYAGSQKVSGAINTAADKFVVSFSNAYLAANSN
jgi:hypothetical protein